MASAPLPKKKISHMNENAKKKYLESYNKLKEKGVPFFPDILFKDALVSLLLLLVLIGLAYFLGAPLEEQANPSDTNYLPRPEWYFRFLFQLLKYFPGNLEVIGVVIIPTIFILLLLALPFLDRGEKRHISKRLVVLAGTVITGVVIIGLSIASYLEAPPPVEVASGDPTAQLYSYNCSGCHGSSSSIPLTEDLHKVISQGNHEGMPAWSADLTVDEIDALAGFILSPTGSEVFNQNCSDCHAVGDLVYSDPKLLRQVMNFLTSQENHTGPDVPFANQALTIMQRASLINFLIAPDGKRLFTSYCSSCHGTSVAILGDEAEFRQLVIEGGQHREMPAWGETLNSDQLNELANYVFSPTDYSVGATIFLENCTECHFQNIPYAESVEDALVIIESGDTHDQMPVWGDILEEEQIDALVSYAYSSVSSSLEDRGQSLYLENCAQCHGEYGEGGVNPSQAGDVIAPISSAEYLATRDDFTLKEVIARGQPNFGMSPFGLSYGGPLDTGDVDLLVSFIRAWEADPPVEFPPEIQVRNINLSGAEIYQSICAQCHGENGAGAVGPSLRSPWFKSSNDQQDIFDSINLGHEATPMISWGEILSSEQIKEIVDFLDNLPELEDGNSAELSFAARVEPTFDKYCISCHDNSFAEGDWNATTYEKILKSGSHAPVIIPGDVENSLLAQMILGNLGPDQLMPPSGNISENAVRVIIEWIENGSLDN